MAPPAPVGEGDRRTAQRLYGGGLYKRRGSSPAPAGGDGRYDSERMQAVWLTLAFAVLAVGLFFLVRAFVRLQKQVLEVRTAMKNLGDMGPRLQQLGQDMGKLAESLEQERPQ